MIFFKKLRPFENKHEAEIIRPSSDELKHPKEALGRFC